MYRLGSEMWVINRCSGQKTRKGQVLAFRGQMWYNTAR